MSPWDWCALTLIALVVVAGVLVLVYWAIRAINVSIRKSVRSRAGDEDASRAADRMIVVSQLWMGVGLIVFGATIAVLFGVVFSDRDIDKVALSIGTAVIGTGAALLPAGASASASGRINTSIQKENGAGGNGDGTIVVVPPPDEGAPDTSTTTTTTTTTTDTTGAGDTDVPPSDMDIPPADMDIPTPDPGAPPTDVPEPPDATGPGDTTAPDEEQPPAGEGDPKK
jgi:hypothetical protein